MRRCRTLAFLFLSIASILRAAEPEALLVIVGDQHSAYERTAQFVAHIDRLRAEYPGAPLAILIDGDSLEYGNVVARRSAGAVDFAMFAALAKRAPTILNLGNHDPEFYAVDDTVSRIRATGVTVISNLLNHTTHQPFAPASTRLKLGPRDAIVVGIATDDLSTYRVAIRPSLDLTDPGVWAKKNFPALFASPAAFSANSAEKPAAPLTILLSHAGITADRALLPLVPDGTLFAGAHDHVRFVHSIGRTVYFHSGSWLDGFSLATLTHDATGPIWSVQTIPIALTDPVDPRLAALIRETSAQYLTSDDTAVIGRTAGSYSPAEAASFVTAALRDGAHTDAAIIGGTTFGAGLPAGNVTRSEFDACVRFDGTIFIAELSGTELAAILATTNQVAATPFAARRGENLVAVSLAAPLEPKRRYRLATTDWAANHAGRYFGTDTLTFVEHPALKLKALALAALHSPPASAR